MTSTPPVPQVDFSDPVRLAFDVVVELEPSGPRHAPQGDMRAAVRAALEKADPCRLVAINGAEYGITVWSVEAHLEHP